MLVEKAQLGSIEEDHVKPLALRLLNACLTVDLGVLRALKAGAVAVSEIYVWFGVKIDPPAVAASHFPLPYLPV